MRPAFLLALLVPLAALAQDAPGLASDAPRGARAATEPDPTALRAKGRAGDDGGDLTAAWLGTPQWLEGVPFSGSAFDGGAYYGRDWFSGSSVSAFSDVPVEIVLDEAVTTLGRIWRRDRGYADDGVGSFRGAAYDVSDPDSPRRLNVTFVEDNRLCGGADRLWDPAVDQVGCREYLYVMASDYDSDGSTYGERSPFDGDFDLAYVLAMRVPVGRALYESSPATLALGVPTLRYLSTRVPTNGLVELGAVYTPEAGLPDGATIGFTFAADGDSPAAVGTTIPAGAEPLEVSGSLDGLDASRFYTFRAVIEDASGAVIRESRGVRVRPRVQLNATLASRWSERGSWADVWGYTAPDGREYALVALQNFGLSVIDVTGGTAAEVGFVPTASGARDSKDVKVVGEYAYLVNEVGPIQIVSLANPAQPRQVGTLDVQPGIGNGGAHNVAVDGGYLYVTGGRTSGNAGLRIYDARTTPEAPTLVSEYRPDHFTTPYYHDFYVDGTTGYGPNIYGGGVDILDLTDPANPTRVSTFSYPQSGAHNVCGTADGRYIFVGDEIGTAGNWTRVFDVADPLNVELVAEVIVDAQAVVHNCYVTGDLLHIGHYTEGYRVFDVSDPTAPTEVAFYDTFPEGTYGFGGVWSIYPYFPSGQVAVSDRNTGLYMVDLTLQPIPTEPPVLPGPPTLTVGPNPASGVATVRAVGLPSGSVRVAVYDARGREVRVLLTGETAGVVEVALNTSALAPGAYVVRLEGEQMALSQTFSVVR